MMGRAFSRLVPAVAVGAVLAGTAAASGGTAQAAAVTAARPDRAALVGLWQQADKALRSKDVETLAKLSSARGGLVLKEIPAAERDAFLDVAIDMLPDTWQPGELSVDGDKATLAVSGLESGKPTTGKAYFVREKGEWKVDSVWKPMQ